MDVGIKLRMIKKNYRKNCAAARKTWNIGKTSAVCSDHCLVINVFTYFMEFHSRFTTNLKLKKDAFPIQYPRRAIKTQDRREKLTE